MTPFAGGGWDRLHQSEQPASDVLPEPAERPPPWHTFSVAALCRSPERFFGNFASRFAHLPAPNFRPSNQATIDSLRNRLPDEVPLDRAGFDQVEDRPQRRRNLEALHCFYVALG